MKERRMVQPGCWSPSRVKEAFIRGQGVHSAEQGDTHPGTKTAQATPRVGVVVFWGFLGPQWAEKDIFKR